MIWFGDGMTGWGHPATALVVVLAWWVVGLGAYALARRLDRRDRVASAPQTPERVLAERFARGEIDAAEYRERLEVLTGPVPR
ncbi:hypothetical protein GCM10017691_27200 [Pseudonocardia petroleophila]|uniref:SHOCT domain-containing protein n=1 Tax=Pseudonocardia petroleophila TaxID=37331 RepID=A0A7G7MF23_9PSEU|nr:SHOCT domain-containing protein [Pseudonocardia petroleophila]QNG51384.1 SHOCT domain-containing protein [Pseudonocardia petroleophila]